jgi:signal transduction histidine kinase
MNDQGIKLKYKISLIVSSIFTVLFGIAGLVIYTLFSDFRKNEFESRLNEKAKSSIRLLIDIKEVDRQVIKLIDQHSIEKLLDEKTLIFDSNFNLLYSSLDDSKIEWDYADLEYLRNNKSFFKKEGKYEVYGYFYDTNDKDYYALISASDNLGERKLEYLVYILILTYIAFVVICWFATSYAVSRLLFPLEAFHQQIKNINEHNLDTEVNIKSKKDEIELLAREFNLMLHRINESYQRQKEFTAYASHELRTPIARVAAQLENKIHLHAHNEELSAFFGKLLTDIHQISELINSLLLLSRLDNKQLDTLSLHRIDELFYEAIEKLHKNFPEFKINLDIEYTEGIDDLMEIKGSKSLLEIAVMNLLKNACIYANDHQAKVFIAQKNNNLELIISNNGKALSPKEQKKLFQPFMRGNNAKGKSGLGLGLRIVQRILFQHHAQISYEAPSTNSNLFKITFKH